MKRKNDMNDVATEVRGISANLSMMMGTLENDSKVSSEQFSNILYAIIRQLDRIAEDIDEIHEELLQVRQ